MSVEEYREYLKTGVLPGEKKKAKSKYGNNGNGTSDLERGHKWEYELQLKFKLIKEYHYQKVFVLKEKCRVNGKAIRAIKYKADHYIVHLDGSQEVVDTKGVETETFRIKMKLFMERFPDIKFTIRKKNKR